MYEALIFNLPLKGCAKNKCARNRGARKLNARKKDAQNFEVERKLSELRYIYKSYQSAFISIEIRRVFFHTL